MGTFLVADDLAPVRDGLVDRVDAEEKITDAEALAVLAAPCLGAEDVELTPKQFDAVRAILRGAILRWIEAGTGALVTQSTGPFAVGYDNRQQRRGMFWPSELTQLQDVCGGTIAGGAFSFVPTPACGSIHADICSLNFGALYCSCGADLTGSYPLWEV